MSRPTRDLQQLLLCLLLLGCGGAEPVPIGASPRALTPQEQRGREIWFKSTFGGEKFFSLIMPGPPFNLRLGIDRVITSSRATRFDEWGVVNDPECAPGDASTGFLDRCADPNSAGVVGIRRFPNPLPGGPPLIGVACASCHAGLDPERPPADPNQPGWDNIHPTIGSQYLQIGKVFQAHLTPADPRWQVFHRAADAPRPDHPARGHAGGAVRQPRSGEPAAQPVPGPHRERRPPLRRAVARIGQARSSSS